MGNLGSIKNPIKSVKHWGIKSATSDNPRVFLFVKEIISLVKSIPWAGKSLCRRNIVRQIEPACSWSYVGHGLIKPYGKGFTHFHKEEDRPKER